MVDLRLLLAAFFLMEEDERYPTRVMLTSVVLNSISLFILHTPKRNPLECIGITVLVLESN